MPSHPHFWPGKRPSSSAAGASAVGMFSYVETFVLHDRDVLRSIARVDVDLVWGVHHGDVAARGVTSGRPCSKKSSGAPSVFTTAYRIAQ